MRSLKWRFLLLLIALGIAAFYYFDQEVAQVQGEDLISPTKETINLKTRLYFVDGDTLKFENRTVTVRIGEFESGLMQAYLAGPKTTSYGSLFETGVQLKSVHYAEHVCYVNLSRAFHEITVTEDQMALYLWGIVNSLTEIDRVFSVQFLVEGEKLSGELNGYPLTDPLPRMDSLIYVPSMTPADVVIAFIEAVNGRRYDLAYEMLSADSQRVLGFEEFEIYMEGHRRSFDGYVKGLHFTQLYRGETIVNVIYDRIVQDELAQDAQKTDRYLVIEENREWKIDLLQKIQDEGTPEAIELP